MKLSLFLVAVLPLSALACAPPTGEEVGATADEIAIDDLGPLERNFGLVKDRARTRPEARVKAGPCYQKMQASGRDWDLRRYTEGAAFFFKRPNGTLIDPIACVDLDVATPAQPTTIALEGQTLDVAQRYDFGRLTMAVSGKYLFERGTMIVDTRVVEKDGGIAPIFHLATGPGLTIQEWAPDMTEAMAGMSLLAYRYAKQDPGLPMAEDPVGRFEGLMDGGTTWIGRFEKVDIEQRTFDGESPGKMYTLTSRATNAPLAGCVRFTGGPKPHRYSCFINPAEGKWEVPWGADFH